MDKQQDTSSNMPVPLLDVTEPFHVTGLDLGVCAAGDTEA